MANVAIALFAMQRKMDAYQIQNDKKDDAH
jgi:hypothetical protein